MIYNWESNQVSTIDGTGNWLVTARKHKTRRKMISMALSDLGASVHKVVWGWTLEILCQPGAARPPNSLFLFIVSLKCLSTPQKCWFELMTVNCDKSWASFVCLCVWHFWSQSCREKISQVHTATTKLSVEPKTKRKSVLVWQQIRTNNSWESILSCCKNLSFPALEKQISSNVHKCHKAFWSIRRLLSRALQNRLSRAFLFCWHVHNFDETSLCHAFGVWKRTSCVEEKKGSDRTRNSELLTSWTDHTVSQTAMSGSESCMSVDSSVKRMAHLQPLQYLTNRLLSSKSAADFDLCAAVLEILLAENFPHQAAVYRGLLDRCQAVRTQIPAQRPARKGAATQGFHARQNWRASKISVEMFWKINAWYTLAVWPPWLKIVGDIFWRTSILTRVKNKRACVATP